MLGIYQVSWLENGKTSLKPRKNLSTSKYLHRTHFMIAHLKYWIEGARLNTLPASMTPVLIASALAYYENGFQLLVFLYCLAFAVLGQIGSNYANDYLDSKKVPIPKIAQGLGD